MGYLIDQDINRVSAPALPMPPVQYDKRHAEQLNNALRLYFTQLDNVLRGIMATQENAVFNRMNLAMTSFDELSVAESTSIIDLKACFPLSAKRDKVTATGAASVTQQDGHFLVQTTANGADSVIFESVQRGDYIAGLESLAGNAIQVDDRPTGNQEVEWGYTDFSNGFVWGEDANGMFIRLYSGGSAVVTVRRADWDNPLADVLDPSKLIVYRNPFDYYGQGPVKYDFVSGDTLYLCHTLMNPNTSGPIFQQPNLPLNLRIRNSGTAAAMRVKVVGRQYLVKGRIEAEPRESSETRIGQTVTTTFTPLVSWRQKTGGYDAVTSMLNAIDVITDTDIIYQIRSSATLTGPSWIEMTFSDSGKESALQWDISATGVSGGLKEHEGLVAGAKGSASTVKSADLPQARMPNNEVVVCLCARVAAATGTATVTATLKAKERW